jgi:hypothetical protein
MVMTVVVGPTTSHSKKIIYEIGRRTSDYEATVRFYEGS